MHVLGGLSYVNEPDPYARPNQAMGLNGLTSARAVAGSGNGPKATATLLDSTPSRVESARKGNSPGDFLDIARPIADTREDALMHRI
jgi:hypothetical protein